MTKEKRKEYNLLYYFNNKQKIKNQKRKYYQKNKKYLSQYRQIHKQKTKEYNKVYWIINKEKNKQRFKKWVEKNKEKRKQYMNQYNKNRRNTDINYKLITNLRNRIWNSIKNNAKSKHTKELIGCTIDQLKKHLESKFIEGMTWGNYGEWHIDHIRPCSSFDMKNPEEQKKCFHYSNLQPLWAEDNLKKHNHY